MAEKKPMFSTEQGAPSVVKDNSYQYAEAAIMEQGKRRKAVLDAALGTAVSVGESIFVGGVEREVEDVLARSSITTYDKEGNASLFEGSIARKSRETSEADKAALAISQENLVTSLKGWDTGDQDKDALIGQIREQYGEQFESVENARKNSVIGQREAQARLAAIWKNAYATYPGAAKEIGKVFTQLTGRTDWASREAENALLGDTTPAASKEAKLMEDLKKSYVLKISDDTKVDPRVLWSDEGTLSAMGRELALSAETLRTEQQLSASVKIGNAAPDSFLNLARGNLYTSMDTNIDTQLKALSAIHRSSYQSMQTMDSGQVIKFKATVEADLEGKKTLMLNKLSEVIAQKRDYLQTNGQLNDNALAKLKEDEDTYRKRINELSFGTVKMLSTWAEGDDATRKKTEDILKIAGQLKGLTPELTNDALVIMFTSDEKSYLDALEQREGKIRRSAVESSWSYIKNAVLATTGGKTQAWAVAEQLVSDAAITGEPVGPNGLKDKAGTDAGGAIAQIAMNDNAEKYSKEAHTGNPESTNLLRSVYSSVVPTDSNPAWKVLKNEIADGGMSKFASNPATADIPVRALQSINKQLDGSNTGSIMNSTLNQLDQTLGKSTVYKGFKLDIKEGKPVLMVSLPGKDEKWVDHVTLLRENQKLGIRNNPELLAASALLHRRLEPIVRAKDQLESIIKQSVKE